MYTYNMTYTAPCVAPAWSKFVTMSVCPCSAPMRRGQGAVLFVRRHCPSGCPRVVVRRVCDKH